LLSGLHFVDIWVGDNADTDTGSCLGDSYANDTGLHGQTVLTGSKCFTVKEIEVFEITESTALPNPAHLPLKSRFRQGNCPDSFGSRLKLLSMPIDHDIEMNNDMTMYNTIRAD
jgi:hypothetical protein